MIREPLQFAPLFMERIWGGRRLEQLYRKPLPEGISIGESWEITDRPEAQSVVLGGPLRGETLHALWMNRRREIFGELPESARFPLLVKLLDAQERLSIQVHPPAGVASELGGEAKSEFWYIADAMPDAELFVGLRKGVSAADFERAVGAGTADQLVHRIRVKAGGALFLPSGRLHAIGAGNVIVEIQQNSDTTYRVFDWNRLDADGQPRELHINEALRCIDFDDCEPPLLQPMGETLVRNPLFEIQQWDVNDKREVAPPGQFAIVFCLAGTVVCGSLTFAAGEFFLVPATLPDRQIQSQSGTARILRITIPR